MTNENNLQIVAQTSSKPNGFAG